MLDYFLPFRMKLLANHAQLTYLLSHYWMQDELYVKIFFSFILVWVGGLTLGTPPGGLRLPFKVNYGYFLPYRIHLTSKTHLSLIATLYHTNTPLLQTS